MRVTQDLTGQIFGKWTVIEKDIERTKTTGITYWTCRCECGTIRSVQGQSLKNGKSSSCGCSKIKNLKGNRYGYLEALEIDKSKHERLTYWLCKCHGCGRIISVDSRSLQHGMQSCGCKRYDIVSEKMSAHLEGQTFNYLTVLERDKSKPRGRDAYWICRCNNCGNICSIRTNDLQNNRIKSCGCMTSKGEMTLSQLFQQMGIKYKTQYKFDDLMGKKSALKFDFFLPEYNVLIEYQGGQHYKPVEFMGGNEDFQKRQEYDNLKREYCKMNNYKLIEIPYWDYNKLNEEYIKNILGDNKDA